MKFYGKEKCRILKQIRAEIAKQNDIEWVVEECKHKGNCRGTCPKCEAEVRQLERELELRRTLGKTIAVAGIAAGIALTVTGCADIEPTAGDPLPDPADTSYQTAEQHSDNQTTEGDEEPKIELMGDVVYVPSENEQNGETELIMGEEEMPLPGEPAEPDPEEDTENKDEDDELPLMGAMVVEEE